jgi:LCP family protein required for cell wall assembly
MAAGAAAGFAGYEWAQAKLDQRATISLGDGSPAPSSPGGSLVLPLGALCKDTCNYLVLGSDSRATLSSKDQQGFQTDAQINGYRSDTMLLVHIVADTKHATIVSFPRDLIVDIPGYGTDKINAAFSHGAASGGEIPGGAVLAAKTVQELTGLQINHVVVVDLGGFESIVNAVGTVPFCTPVQLVDDPSRFPGYVPGDGGSGLYLDAGCHDLDGATALALVRARDVIAGGVPDCISDFARIGRQQQFMRALMNKLLSPLMLPKLPHLIDVITKQLYFDDRLQVTDLVDLSKALQGVASGNADFRTVPSELAPNNIDVVLSPDARTFLDKLRRDEPLGDLGTSLQGNAPTPGNIAVRVYDDASEGHAPNDVYTAQLSESGFKMMATASESATPELQGMGTTILYNKGYEEQAKVVAQYVPGPYPIKEAKPGQLPSDTQVGVVVDVHYTYQDPGSGKTPIVNPDCSL